MNIDKQYLHDILGLKYSQGREREGGELGNEDGGEVRKMKKIHLLIFSVFLGVLMGCGPAVRSSGLLVACLLMQMINS